MGVSAVQKLSSTEQLPTLQSGCLVASRCERMSGSTAKPRSSVRAPRRSGGTHQLTLPGKDLILSRFGRQAGPTTAFGWTGVIPNSLSVKAKNIMVEIHNDRVRS